ncbi:MAG: DUF1990 domain-containing protein [Cryobacterium sp.]|nr:DUF1990 domain-containing protein [Oligoflexia bacterium]
MNSKSSPSFADLHSPIQPTDGKLRPEKIPSLVGLFLRRALKRGQKYVLILEATPPLLPPKVSQVELNSPAYKNVQFMKDGTGPLFFKRYSLSIYGSLELALGLMRKIQADPNLVAPRALAYYRKTKGSPENLSLGDEFFIEMTGPWNGPVRTVEVRPNSFRFVTLNGHMEAGQIEIEFRTGRKPGVFTFEIKSWARSRDGSVDFFYDTLKLAQLMQAEMWSGFLEKTAELAGGKASKNVLIETQRNDTVLSLGM